eukprot:PhM_4_TR3599/c0_g1_i1/m.44972
MSNNSRTRDHHNHPSSLRRRRSNDPASRIDFTELGLDELEHDDVAQSMLFKCSPPDAAIAFLEQTLASRAERRQRAAAIKDNGGVSEDVVQARPRPSSAMAMRSTLLLSRKSRRLLDAVDVDTRTRPSSSAAARGPLHSCSSTRPPTPVARHVFYSKNDANEDDVRIAFHSSRVTRIDLSSFTLNEGNLFPVLDKIKKNLRDEVQMIDMSSLRVTGPARRRVDRALLELVQTCRCLCDIKLGFPMSSTLATALRDNAIQFAEREAAAAHRDNERRKAQTEAEHASVFYNFLHWENRIRLAVMQAEEEQRQEHLMKGFVRESVLLRQRLEARRQFELYEMKKVDTITDESVRRRKMTDYITAQWRHTQRVCLADLCIVERAEMSAAEHSEYLELLKTKAQDARTAKENADVRKRREIAEQRKWMHVETSQRRRVRINWMVGYAAMRLLSNRWCRIKYADWVRTCERQRREAHEQERLEENRRQLESFRQQELEKARQRLVERHERDREDLLSSAKVGYKGIYQVWLTSVEYIRDLFRLHAPVRAAHETYAKALYAVMAATRAAPRLSPIEPRRLCSTYFISTSTPCLFLRDADVEIEDPEAALDAVLRPLNAAKVTYLAALNKAGIHLESLRSVVRAAAKRSSNDTASSLLPQLVLMPPAVPINVEVEELLELRRTVQRCVVRACVRAEEDVNDHVESEALLPPPMSHAQDEIVSMETFVSFSSMGSGSSPSMFVASGTTSKSDLPMFSQAKRASPEKNNSTRVSSLELEVTQFPTPFSDTLQALKLSIGYRSYVMATLGFARLIRATVEFTFPTLDPAHPTSMASIDLDVAVMVCNPVLSLPSPTVSWTRSCLLGDAPLFPNAHIDALPHTSALDKIPLNVYRKGPIPKFRRIRLIVSIMNVNDRLVFCPANPAWSLAEGDARMDDSVHLDNVGTAAPQERWQGCQRIVCDHALLSSTMPSRARSPYREPGGHVSFAPNTPDSEVNSVVAYVITGSLTTTDDCAIGRGAFTPSSVTSGLGHTFAPPPVRDVVIELELVREGTPFEVEQILQSLHFFSFACVPGERSMVVSVCGPDESYCNVKSSVIVERVEVPPRLHLSRMSLELHALTPIPQNYPALRRHHMHTMVPLLRGATLEDDDTSTMYGGYIEVRRVSPSSVASNPASLVFCARPYEECEVAFSHRGLDPFSKRGSALAAARAEVGQCYFLDGDIIHDGDVVAVLTKGVAQSSVSVLPPHGSDTDSDSLFISLSHTHCSLRAVRAILRHVCLYLAQPPVFNTIDAADSPLPHTRAPISALSTTPAVYEVVVAFGPTKDVLTVDGTVVREPAGTLYSTKATVHTALCPPLVNVDPLQPPRAITVRPRALPTRFVLPEFLAPASFEFGWSITAVIVQGWEPEDVLVLDNTPEFQVVPCSREARANYMAQNHLVLTGGNRNVSVGSMTSRRRLSRTASMSSTPGKVGALRRRTVSMVQYSNTAGLSATAPTSRRPSAAVQSEAGSLTHTPEKTNLFVGGDRSGSCAPVAPLLTLEDVQPQSRTDQQDQQDDRIFQVPSLVDALHIPSGGIHSDGSNDEAFSTRGPSRRISNDDDIAPPPPDAAPHLNRRQSFHNDVMNHIAAQQARIRVIKQQQGSDTASTVEDVNHFLLTRSRDSGEVIGCGMVSANILTLSMGTMATLHQVQLFIKAMKYAYIGDSVPIGHRLIRTTISDGTTSAQLFSTVHVERGAASASSALHLKLLQERVAYPPGPGSVIGVPLNDTRVCLVPFGRGAFRYNQERISVSSLRIEFVEGVEDGDDLGLLLPEEQRTQIATFDELSQSVEDATRTWTHAFPNGVSGWLSPCVFGRRGNLIYRAQDGGGDCVATIAEPPEEATTKKKGLVFEFVNAMVSVDELSLLLNAVTYDNPRAQFGGGADVKKLIINLTELKAHTGGATQQPSQPVEHKWAVEISRLPSLICACGPRDVLSLKPGMGVGHYLAVWCPPCVDGDEGALEVVLRGSGTDAQLTLNHLQSAPFTLAASSGDESSPERNENDEAHRLVLYNAVVVGTLVEMSSAAIRITFTRQEMVDSYILTQWLRCIGVVPMTTSPRPATPPGVQRVDIRLKNGKREPVVSVCLNVDVSGGAGAVTRTNSGLGNSGRRGSIRKDVV